MSGVATTLTSIVWYVLEVSAAIDSVDEIVYDKIIWLRPGFTKLNDGRFQS